MTAHVEVRHGVYADSVSLMLVTRDVQASDGVEAAVIAMATPLNLDLLDAQGFTVPADAMSNDLVVAIRATDDDRLSAALATLEAALAATRRAATAGQPWPVGAGGQHRTVGTASAASGAGAAHAAPGIALISVPGPHAFVEAMDALRAGLHPMIFSDNVPLAQEVILKVEAERRGLLCMGPDCGTAIIGGVGLGFANVVAPGPVSIVAASGTGAQQLCALLDDAGVGIRHVIGVGGRDLSHAVGGRSTLAALRALEDDPGTELILVVSKPPDPGVGAVIDQAGRELTTRVVACYLDDGEANLTAAAAAALRALGLAVEEPTSWPARIRRDVEGGELRGLFTGGTLCHEAMAVAAPVLGAIGSNIPRTGGWELPDDLRADGHLAIDFGDDRLTRGRPHPMIDQTMRIERIDEEARRPGNPVLLLDVVLGHGAHHDPAADLAPTIEHARATATRRGDTLAVVVSLCGTSGDPQDRDAQADALCAAGASVHLSNAAAAKTAVRLIRPDAPFPAVPW